MPKEHMALDEAMDYLAELKEKYIQEKDNDEAEKIWRQIIILVDTYNITDKDLQMR